MRNKGVRILTFNPEPPGDEFRKAMEIWNSLSPEDKRKRAAQIVTFLGLKTGMLRKTKRGKIVRTWRSRWRLFKSHLYYPVFLWRNRKFDKAGNVR